MLNLNKRYKQIESLTILISAVSFVTLVTCKRMVTLFSCLFIWCDMWLIRKPKQRVLSRYVTCERTWAILICCKSCKSVFWSLVLLGENSCVSLACKIRLSPRNAKIWLATCVVTLETSWIHSYIYFYYFHMMWLTANQDTKTEAIKEVCCFLAPVDWIWVWFLLAQNANSWIWLNSCTLVCSKCYEIVSDFKLYSYNFYYFTVAFNLV